MNMYNYNKQTINNNIKELWSTEQEVRNSGQLFTNILVDLWTRSKNLTTEEALKIAWAETVDLAFTDARNDLYL